VATEPLEEVDVIVDPGGTLAPARAPRHVARLLRDPETLRAAAMAIATMAANLIAVGITVVFTRMLGTDGYGSLAALLNLSVILYVPGSALQVAAAREGMLGRLGDHHARAALLRRWTRTLLVALAVVAGLSALLRQPLAHLLNVDAVWAAAAVPVTAVLWLLVSVQRGLLQAERAYRAVGLSIVAEAGGRLAVGAALVAAGLGVTGAYLGTPAALAVLALVLAVLLGRRLGEPAAAAPDRRLRRLAATAAVPTVVLVLVAALQNADVIVARHVLDPDQAGVYAAATVAAKALVWLAIGLGVWLLPEAVRRAAAGGDPLPVLGRTLALVALVAVPALAAYATVPELVLRTAFGPDYESGAPVLLTLGAAYALLAVSYLSVQYLLGLGTRRLVVVMGIAAVAEPAALLLADGLSGFAAVVLAVQALTAVAVLALALLRSRRLAALPPR
jgi:O-antigen/teichoic acid export membrane protein